MWVNNCVSPAHMPLQSAFFAESLRLQLGIMPWARGTEPAKQDAATLQGQACCPLCAKHVDKEEEYIEGKWLCAQ